MIDTMASCVRYLTHPQVQIDAAVPVPEWRLSPVGRARAQKLAEAGWLRATTRIVSSGERKAMETADILARAIGQSFVVRENMHENDRSATGFLPPAEFETVADQFFGQPEISIRGWERAIDAQARIMREVEAALLPKHVGDVLFVGHGAVGTLLYCHLAGLPISRKHDQPVGGGNIFAFEHASRRVQHAWRSIEELT